MWYRFLCKSGDMYEQYYLSLESVFDNALKLMKQFLIEEVEDFIESLRKVVRKADHTGWSHHDTISDILNQAYRDLP